MKNKSAEHDHLFKPLKSERKTIDDLWDEYKARYDDKPKHDYPHFITVMSSYKHHSEIIRPMIKHWQRMRKEMNIINPKFK